MIHKIEWVTQVIPVDELGNGVVDIYGASTTGTDITANVYDYGMTPIDGFIGRELPLSLSGLGWVLIHRGLCGIKFRN